MRLLILEREGLGGLHLDRSKRVGRVTSDKVRVTKGQVCTHHCPDHRENQDQQPLLATLRKALDAQEKNNREVFEDCDEPGRVLFIGPKSRL